MFTAVAIRGRLDLSRTENDWPAIGTDPDALRVVAFLDRLERLRSEDVSSVAYEVIFDAPTAARLLTPVVPEQTISLLEKLATARVLRLAPQFERLAWALANRTEPSAHTRPSVARTDVVVALLKAIAATADGQLRPRDARLDVAERAMRNAFKRAADAGLIKATTDGLHDRIAPTALPRTVAASFLGRKNDDSIGIMAKTDEMSTKCQRTSRQLLPSRVYRSLDQAVEKGCDQPQQPAAVYRSLR